MKKPKRVAYSIAEVAAMTGRDRSTIWRWRQTGALETIKPQGGREMITAASLEKLLRRSSAAFER